MTPRRPALAALALALASSMFFSAVGPPALLPGAVARGADTYTRWVHIYSLSSWGWKKIDPRKHEIPDSVEAGPLSVDDKRNGTVRIDASAGDEVHVKLVVAAYVYVLVWDKANVDEHGNSPDASAGTVHYRLVHKPWSVELSYTYAGGSGTLVAARPQMAPVREDTESFIVKGGIGLCRDHSAAGIVDEDRFTAAENDSILEWNATIHVEELDAMIELIATNDTVKLEAHTIFFVRLNVTVVRQGGGSIPPPSAYEAHIDVLSNVDGIVAGSSGVNFYFSSYDGYGTAGWKVTPATISQPHDASKLLSFPGRVLLANGSWAYLDRIDYYYYGRKRVGQVLTCGYRFAGSYRPWIDVNSVPRPPPPYRWDAGWGDNVTKVGVKAAAPPSGWPDCGYTYSLDSNIFSGTYKAKVVALYTTKPPSWLRVETSIDPYAAMVNGTRVATPYLTRLGSTTRLSAFRREVRPMNASLTGASDAEVDYVGDGVWRIVSKDTPNILTGWAEWSVAGGYVEVVDVSPSGLRVRLYVDGRDLGQIHEGDVLPANGTSIRVVFQDSPAYTEKITLRMYTLGKYFTRWEVYIDGELQHVVEERNITLAPIPGSNITARAVYPEMDTLTVGTNVNSTVNIAGVVDGHAVSLLVSDAVNWSHTAPGGFNYTLTAPPSATVTWMDTAIRGETGGGSHTDTSPKAYTGTYNVTVRLRALVDQRRATVWLYAANGTGQRLLGSWSRSEWRDWTIRLHNVALNGERLNLTIQRGQWSTGTLRYAVDLEKQSRLPFTAWLANGAPIYGRTVSGAVEPGQAVFLEALYGSGSETYMGPVLPGTLVLPEPLSPGVHHAYGDFMVRVVNYTGTYLLPLPAPINCSGEYRAEGRRLVRVAEFPQLPRVGAGENFFVMFEAPRSLGERRLCLGQRCYVYNVTRLVLEIEGVRYNRTHLTLRLRPGYECCPAEPVREHLVYVFLVARRGVPLEQGVLAESPRDTPVIVVPYSRLQFLVPVRYRLYARFSLGGPVPLQVGPRFALYYGSVKPLVWDDSRGRIVFSKPYVWRADREFSPMPWNGSPGEVWVYVEGWGEWYRAGWNGTNFVVDIGRPTWGLRVRIVWVPPDLEGGDAVIVPLVQRW